MISYADYILWLRHLLLREPTSVPIQDYDWFFGTLISVCAAGAVASLLTVLVLVLSLLW